MVATVVGLFKVSTVNVTIIHREKHCGLHSTLKLNEPTV